MSEALVTIREMIGKVQTELEGCKPKSLSESDIDKAAKLRAQLREKLAVLQTEEENELANIAQAEALDKAQRRETLLLSLVKKSEEQEKLFSGLNKKIEKAMSDLVELIKERHDLFPRYSFGTRTPEAREVLSKEDQEAIEHELAAIRYRGFQAAASRELGEAWYLAVENHVSSQDSLHEVLRTFLEGHHYPSHLPGVRSGINTICQELLQPVEDDVVEEVEMEVEE